MATAQARLDGRQRPVALALRELARPPDCQLQPAILQYPTAH